MLKNNITCTLWLFLAIAVFTSCNNVNVTESNRIEISDPMFIQISRFTSLINVESDWLYQNIVDAFTSGDTMVVGCRVKNPNWNDLYDNYDEMRKRPIDPPIVARVTSSETGDVQYINFEQDIFPIGANIPVLGNKPRLEWLCIAFISPVKYNDELNNLIPDLTKQELNISPNGDILTAEIMYEDQLLTKTIIVKRRVNNVQTKPNTRTMAIFSYSYFFLLW